MTVRNPAVRERLTPNQLDKQRQIVRAAMDVLATKGLAGCTAREIAGAGPLTKSAIHYYFADMDDLIDRAMAEHVAAFDAALRAVGTEGDDPVSRFWQTTEAYLATFRDRPHVAYLWFEYWIHSSRQGRLAPVRQMHEQVAALLAERLAAAGAPAAAKAAQAVLVYLLGAIVEQSVDPRAAGEVGAHVARLAGLAAAKLP
jgi:AcrR family transcriptional regulator